MYIVKQLITYMALQCGILYTRIYELAALVEQSIVPIVVV